MKICINDIMYSLSYALDSVEGELLHATPHHAKRVAYMAVNTGKQFGMAEKTLLNLAIASVLHDNALTEYIQSEVRMRGTSENTGNFGDHCVIGERNVSRMPFYKETPNVILYHHELADGTGPFGKRASETPLSARLIHIADQVDVRFDLSSVSREKYDSIIKYISENTGSLFDPETASAFLSTFSLDVLHELSGENIIGMLKDTLPVVYVDYTNEELIGISTMFAKIIDYKSSFTCTHSSGVAQKAMAMGKFWGYDETEQAKLYLAGSLHDIGKLVIGNDVLEKPSSLTTDEYKYIQTHAAATYQILKTISGFEDMCDWASFHHEMLDGSGYPFGYTADRLNRNERLMACVDIYQALSEKRPYKDGLQHEAAMKILNDMASKGKLDADIVKDIGICFSGRAV